RPPASSRLAARPLKGRIACGRITPPGAPSGLLRGCSEWRRAQPRLPRASSARGTALAAPALRRVRDRLRGGGLAHVDRAGGAFAALLHLGVEVAQRDARESARTDLPAPGAVRGRRPERERGRAVEGHGAAALARPLVGGHGAAERECLASD